jgi:outer membrane protein OmpA-like peptidoglycan-associated protein
MTFARLAGFAFLLQLVALAPAMAADWDSDTTRLLGDPSFLPLAGQIEGSIASTAFLDRYDYRDGPSVAFPDSFRRTGFSFLPELNYGITDEVSVFANLVWGNSFNREDFTAGVFVSQPPGFLRLKLVRETTTFHALGADDPVFGATWRAIDQARAPVNVDVTGTYSPDIFTSRSAGTTQTGSIATGGQAGSVQVAISREMQLLTVRAYGNFGYEGRRNDIADDGFDDLRSASHATYSAGLQTELRVLPWLALHAGVSASEAMQYDQTIIYPLSVGGQVTEHPSGSISPYGGVLIPLLDRRLVAEIVYQHDFINNETRQFLYEIGSRGYLAVEGRYFKQESDQVTATLRFVFGGAPAAMPAPLHPSPLQQAIPTPIVDYTYIVFFDWDRADLSARARAIVAEAAQGAGRQKATRIEVEGYTDLSGTAAYNNRLSLRRARSVEAELVRDGVSPGEIGIHGYGESNPLVPTAAGVREPQNRRVEIILK